AVAALELPHQARALPHADALRQARVGEEDGVARGRVAGVARRRDGRQVVADDLGALLGGLGRLRGLRLRVLRALGWLVDHFRHRSCLSPRILARLFLRLRLYLRLAGQLKVMQIDVGLVKRSAPYKALGVKFLDQCPFECKEATSPFL